MNRLAVTASAIASLSIIAPAQEEPADIADVPSVDLRAGDDEHKRYFLIGHDEESKAPRGGYKLLIVMPGGPGGAEFEPFCRRIHEHALADDYVVAALVSKMWTEDQRIIWPTEKSTVDGMEFTTEEFVDAVIEDVETRVDVDRSHIFTLSWSSSGPAAYAEVLRKESRVTGAFVAMSVFKPEALPKLSNGRKRPFYIYHSEDDAVCPMRMAREAEASLKKAKAKVEFATYEGGHGWHGNVWQAMRDGIEWLEKNHRKAVRHKKPKKREPAAK